MKREDVETILRDVLEGAERAEVQPCDMTFCVEGDYLATLCRAWLALESTQAEVALERNLKADLIHACASANMHAERLAAALRHQRWCRTCGEDGWDSCEEGRAAIDLLRDHDQEGGNG